MQNQTKLVTLLEAEVNYFWFGRLVVHGGSQ